MEQAKDARRVQCLKARDLNGASGKPGRIVVAIERRPVII
jgi:hypothetical protein